MTCPDVIERCTGSAICVHCGGCVPAHRLHELFFSVLTSEHVVAAAIMQRRQCTNDRLGAASTLVAD